MKINESYIYNYLRSVGYTHNGSLALLGNFLAESNGDPHAVENRSFSTYDYNPYDAVGFGIAQHTLAIRKKNLLEFCGEHFAELDWQLKFCVHELTTEGEYTKLNRELRDEDYELYYLVEQVCRIFEKPAVNNVSTRFRLASIANISGYNEVETKVEVKENIKMDMLRKGSKGYQVKVLQSLLYLHGYQLEVDGDFGNNTNGAVVSYQTRNGLDPDGIVGDMTWNKLLHG